MSAGGACVRNVLRACSHAGSVSSTSQTRPGALAHCTTASFPQEPGSFPLDIPSPFLLGLSLLKGPCSQQMPQAGCFCEAEKRMRHRIENGKAGEVCDITKEVASTRYQRCPTHVPLARSICHSSGPAAQLLASTRR